MVLPQTSFGAAAAVNDPPRQRAKTELSLGNVSTDPAFARFS